MSRPSHARAAFTLIELSIVLVIVGLLAGGVLVGRDLIKAAEIRSQINQISELNTAVTIFQVKYDCLPGDCTNATQFFTASSQPQKVTNGDGNMQVRGYGTSGGINYNVATLYALYSYVSPEWLYAMDHLSAAALISLPQFDETDVTNSNTAGVGYPKQKAQMGSVAPTGSSYRSQNGGGIVFGYELNTHRIRLGTCSFSGWPASRPVFGCNPPPSTLYALESKLDDGALTTGNGIITNMTYLYDYLLTGSGGSDQRVYCSQTPTNLTNRECAWSIRADF